MESMLKQILGEFLKLDGVTAAVVAGRDGFVTVSFSHLQRPTKGEGE